MKYGKIVGTGNTATVYEWEDNKVLKLFHQDYPFEAIINEFRNASLIRDMDFGKSKVYEIIFLEKQAGIVYDKLDGESLLAWVLETGNIHECAVHMAELHKKILGNCISNAPDYKDFLKNHIDKAQGLANKEEVLYILDKLPDGNTLCHGDFHPGNIFINNGKTAVIDFMNICHGPYLYDVARTVFLVEYTPVPEEFKEREKILLFKKSLADLYLTQMNVSREMIQDYLSVITAARMGECPEER